MNAEPLTASVRIAARAKEIFPFLVDPRLIVEWLGDWADLSPEPGGLFAVDMGEVPVRGEYIEVDPPHRIIFTWGVPGREGLEPGSTRVEIILKEDGAETLVELTHYDLPDAEAGNHRSGWTTRLGLLATSAEQHTPAT